ncbi:MAG: TIGR00303 family protein [Chloroflexi bacterium]|nr:TIGR00303 family protein [Chloroflexota bacterium]
MKSSPPATEVARRHKQFDGRPILLVHAEQEGRAFLASLYGRKPLFVLTVAHTETADIDGLSGAGVTAELRRLTAAADAEALVHGRPLCMDGVPSNPGGAPGPVLIALAGLRLTEMPLVIVDAGLRVKPDAPTTVVASQWGTSIVTGDAVPHAGDLFERGRAMAAEYVERGDCLILAESVPGGTTTALSLLCGLGYDAWGKVSSSMPGNAHPLKTTVVRQALAAARARGVTPESTGMEIAAAVGDPMQPFVAGLALTAAQSVPVVLAGGSQMAAVLALMARLASECDIPLRTDRVGIATTSWVANDPTADLAGLVAQIGPVPVIASGLDFSGSRHPPLRRYEQFLVKEGVGAGAAAVMAALLADADRAALLAAIERVYEEIYGITALAGDSES